MNRFPVLMYHSLKDGPLADAHPDKYSVPESQFASNLDYLGKCRYKVESCAGLLSRIKQGLELPEQYCVMTVDDGHISGKRMAGMLKAHGFTATFFVTADYCENRRDFLSAADLRDLIEKGMDIGGHGMTHRSLKHMPADQMKAEIADSMEWISAATGRRPAAMSLPAGQGGGVVCKASFEEGYQLVGDSADRLADVRAVPSVMHRFVVLDGYGEQEIAKLLSGDRSYVVRRRLRQWLLALPKQILRSYDQRRVVNGRDET